MSTAPKPQQTTTPAAAPAKAAPTATRRPTNMPAAKKEVTFLFDKENYIWMIAGGALVFIGFLLMSGGRSANPHEFHYDEIFSFRRITVAPLVIMFGYITAIYGIMKKPKETAQPAQV